MVYGRAGHRRGALQYLLAGACRCTIDAAWCVEVAAALVLQRPMRLPCFVTEAGTYLCNF